MQISIYWISFAIILFIILFYRDLKHRKVPSEKIKENFTNSLAKGALTSLVSGGSIVDACLNGGVMTLVNGIFTCI